MVEQAGESASSLQARITTAVGHLAGLRNADQALLSVVNDAHVSHSAARKQLDRIESEVEALVTDQGRGALDTPSGVRAAQRLLAVKLREIHAVVGEAAAEAAGRAAVLDELRTHYDAHPHR